MYERYSTLYEGLCCALECDLVTEDVFGLHSQVTELTHRWNDALDSIIASKQHGGENFQAAVENLLGVTEEMGMAMKANAPFNEFQARSEWLEMASAAVETYCSEVMDEFDEDAALETELYLEACLEEELAKYDALLEDSPAMEGANLNALNLLRQHHAQVKAIKKEMNAAKKAKDWKTASEKAADIARVSDQITRDLDSIPNSVGSAAIVTIVLALVVIAATVGAAVIGKKVGNKIGYEKGHEPSRNAGMAAGKNAYASKYKELQASSEEKILKANPRMKAKPKPAPAPDPKKKKSLLDVIGGKAQGVVRKAGAELEQTRLDSERNARIKKLREAASAENTNLAREHGKAVSKQVFHDTLKGYTDKGEKIGAAAGAGAITVPAALASLARVLKGKKVVDENGNPKKVPLDANEWNALIRWAKNTVSHTKQVYLEKAKSYKARLAAQEAFRFYMMYTDPAVESYFDNDGMFPATEGVSTESISIWRSHCKEISKLRREMKYAADAKDPKLAANKAREISKKCDETMKMLESLPQSAFSAALPRIAVLIIVSLVGIKVGPWLGHAGGKIIGANMAQAATQDMPKFMGKPIETITEQVFGVAGAFLPGIYAFKSLMAFLKGKIVVTAKGEITTTKISPNEGNAIMNMCKSSIRGCKRKYDNLAKDFEHAASSKDEDSKLLKDSKARASESEIILHENVLAAMEEVFVEMYGEPHPAGVIESFLANI